MGRSWEEGDMIVVSGKRWDTLEWKANVAVSLGWGGVWKRCNMSVARIGSNRRGKWIQRSRIGITIGWYTGTSC